MLTFLCLNVSREKDHKMARWGRRYFLLCCLEFEQEGHSFLTRCLSEENSYISLFFCQRFGETQRYWCSEWSLSWNVPESGRNLKWGVTQREREHNRQIWHAECATYFSMSKWRTEVEVKLSEFMLNLVPMGAQESLMDTFTLSQPVLIVWRLAKSQFQTTWKHKRKPHQTFCSTFYFI